MSDDRDHHADVSLLREDGFRFRVTFGSGMPTLLTDEAPPLGSGSGPNPVALLAAAVGNCLASSLLFCTQKAKVPLGTVEVYVRPVTARNDSGRLRVREMQVGLVPIADAETRRRMERCLGIFEDFCTVAESVKAGIPVSVSVEPREPSWVDAGQRRTGT